MNYKEYLSLYNTQDKINKLAKRYKNKKIAIYGAGEFAQAIFQNYNLSKLNIKAVADIKFKNKEEQDFFGYNCISPEQLGTYDCDVILIANYDYKYFLTLLDDHILYLTPNKNIEIRPLFRLTLKDIFFNKSV